MWQDKEPIELKSEYKGKNHSDYEDIPLNNNEDSALLAHRIAKASFYDDDKKDIEAIYHQMDSDKVKKGGGRGYQLYSSINELQKEINTLKEKLNELEKNGSHKDGNDISGEVVAAQEKVESVYKGVKGVLDDIPLRPDFPVLDEEEWTALKNIKNINEPKEDLEARIFNTDAGLLLVQLFVKKQLLMFNQVESNVRRSLLGISYKDTNAKTTKSLLEKKYKKKMSSFLTKVENQNDENKSYKGIIRESFKVNFKIIKEKVKALDKIDDITKKIEEKNLGVQKAKKKPVPLKNKKNSPMVEKTLRLENAEKHFKNLMNSYKLMLLKNCENIIQKAKNKCKNEGIWQIFSLIIPSKKREVLFKEDAFKKDLENEIEALKKEAKSYKQDIKLIEAILVKRYQLRGVDTSKDLTADQLEVMFISRYGESEEYAEGSILNKVVSYYIEANDEDKKQFWLPIIESLLKRGLSIGKLAAEIRRFEEDENKKEEVSIPKIFNWTLKKYCYQYKDVHGMTPALYKVLQIGINHGKKREQLSIRKDNIIKESIPKATFKRYCDLLDKIVHCAGQDNYYEHILSEESNLISRNSLIHHKGSLKRKMRDEVVEKIKACEILNGIPVEELKPLINIDVGDAYQNLKELDDKDKELDDYKKQNNHYKKQNNHYKKQSNHYKEQLNEKDKTIEYWKAQALQRQAQKKEANDVVQKGGFHNKRHKENQTEISSLERPLIMNENDLSL